MQVSLAIIFEDNNGSIGLGNWGHFKGYSHITNILIDFFFPVSLDYFSRGLGISTSREYYENTLRESIRKKKIELLIQYQDPVLQWHRSILYGGAHLHLQHNPFEVFISLLFSEANLYLLLRFL